MFGLEPNLSFRCGRVRPACAGTEDQVIVLCPACSFLRSLVSPRIKSISIFELIKSQVAVVLCLKTEWFWMCWLWGSGVSFLSCTLTKNHLPPVSNECQNQTGLSLVLERAGWCVPLAIKPQYAHLTCPFSFLHR